MDMRRLRTMSAPLLAAGIVLVLAVFTNSLDIARFSWDFRYYIAMAERGLDAADLVAPFAYRWLWTELVRGIARLGELPASTAFAMVAAAGIFVQLLLVDVFVRRTGRGARAALWVVLWTGLAYANAKFLLFDVYRPETLAFPLMILAILALASGRTLWCIALSAIGLQVREFLAIPLLLAAHFEAWPRYGPTPDRPARPARALLVLAALLAAVAIPRALLPVTHSFQALDFMHEPRAWRGLFGIPLLFRRDLNLVYCLLSYLLPMLILATPSRLADVRARAGRLAGLLIGYTALTLALTLYGGTDLFRFVAFLFVPQAFVLGLFAERASLAEKAYTAIALLLFNRILLPVPNADLGAMLDFYGGWSDRVNAATLARALEAGAFIVGAFVLRRVTNASK
jgi:hypothetical protein